MKFNGPAAALLMVSLPFGAALAADEPPDDTIVEDTLEKAGFERINPDDPDSNFARAILEAESAVHSERLRRVEGPGQIFIRVEKKIEAVGADTGVPVPEYLEIRSVPGAGTDGEDAYFFRKVPPEEAASLAAEEAAFVPGAFGAGLLKGGVATAQLGLFMEAGMGAPFGSMGLGSVAVFGSAENDCVENLTNFEERNSTLENTENFIPPVWASPSPAAMLGGAGCFMMFAGDAFYKAAEVARQSQATATEDFARSREIAIDGLDYEGIEPVGGHPSYRLGAAVDAAFAEALAAASGSDGGGGGPSGDCQQDIRSMNVWIDSETFVRRKVRFDGLMTCGGESQEFCMEHIFDDFRNVPNSTLYEPYQEIFRLCGMLTPEQQEELRQAEAELGDYEAQLAQLPPGQQAMMRRMIEPQVERLRSLARGNAAEFRTITTSIDIDPDFSAQGATPARVDDPQTQVVRIVQIHLQTLGYSPGNTNGELDRRTVVAIVQFQDDNELEVTGEATPQLAGILAAKVDAL
jgi:hypothetical protein